MLIGILVLMLAGASIGATVSLASRDGYRKVPTRC